MAALVMGDLRAGVAAAYEHPSQHGQRGASCVNSRSGTGEEGTPMSMTAQPMPTAYGVSRPWLRCGDGPAQFVPPKDLRAKSLIPLAGPLLWRGAEGGVQPGQVNRTPVAVAHLADDCLQHFERYQNLARDVLDRPVPRHRHQDPSTLVPPEDRFGHLAIQREPVTDDILGVIGTTFLLRPRQQAPDQLVLTDLQVKSDVSSQVKLDGHLVDGPSLLHRAR